MYAKNNNFLSLKKLFLLPPKCPMADSPPSDNEIINRIVRMTRLPFKRAGDFKPIIIAKL